MTLPKKLTAAFLLFLLPLFTPAAEAGQIDLDFQGNTLSANLEEAPLRDLLDQLKQQRGIWVKGTETVTVEETISVRFADLPIEAAFQRMLSGLNYSLAFDRKGAVVGITLLGASMPETRRSRGEVSRYRRPIRRPSLRR